MKLCRVCGQEGTFRPKRNVCNRCRNNAAKQRKIDAGGEVGLKAFQMASWAQSRAKAESKQARKKIYKGIEFGFENRKELETYILDNFSDDIERLLNEGKVPSLDRIDSSKGYIVGNIRVISFEKNSELGIEAVKVPIKKVNFDNTEEIYESIEDCSKKTGIPRASIKWCLTNMNGWYSKGRCQFVRLKEKLVYPKQKHYIETESDNNKEEHQNKRN